MYLCRLYLLLRTEATDSKVCLETLESIVQGVSGLLSQLPLHRSKDGTIFHQKSRTTVEPTYLESDEEDLIMTIASHCLCLRFLSIDLPGLLCVLPSRAVPSLFNSA